ncbi:MAG: hypothetical protein OCD01_13415 [Fibrobacterales bacterium]
MNRRYIPQKKRERPALWSKGTMPYFFIGLVVLLFSIPFWVRISGNLLVVDDVYDSVECGLVITAEGGLEAGYSALVEDLGAMDIKRVILSGSPILKSVSAADIALNELKLEEFDKDRLYYFYHDAETLLEEAEIIIPFLRTKEVKEVVLYTRKHMSGRVKHIYESLAKGNPRFVVRYHSEESFNPKAWIHSSQSRLQWATEWAAYLMNTLELLLYSPTFESEIKVYNYTSGYSVRTKDSDIDVDDSLLEDIPIIREREEENLIEPIDTVTVDTLADQQALDSALVDTLTQDSSLFQ